jgi:hypothetical protein
VKSLPWSRRHVRWSDASGLDGESCSVLSCPVVRMKPPNGSACRPVSRMAPGKPSLLSWCRLCWRWEMQQTPLHEAGSPVTIPYHTAYLGWRQFLTTLVVPPWHFLRLAAHFRTEGSGLVWSRSCVASRGSFVCLSPENSASALFGHAGKALYVAQLPLRHPWDQPRPTGLAKGFESSQQAEGTSLTSAAWA